MHGKVDRRRGIAKRKKVPHHRTCEALTAHFRVHRNIAQIRTCIFSLTKGASRNKATFSQGQVIRVGIDLGACGIAIERLSVKFPANDFGFECDDPVHIQRISTSQHPNRPWPPSSHVRLQDCNRSTVKSGPRAFAQEVIANVSSWPNSQTLDCWERGRVLVGSGRWGIYGCRAEMALRVPWAWQLVAAFPVRRDPLGVAQIQTAVGCGAWCSTQPASTQRPPQTKKGTARRVPFL